MSLAPLPFTKFASDVLHLQLSPAWRVLLLVAVDGLEPCELEGEEREIARKLFGDVDTIPEDARRVLVWRLGRGSGKTTIAAALAIYTMWTADVSRVGPGMLSAAVIVAPTKPTARISINVARELVRRSSLERCVAEDVADGFAMQRPDGRVVHFMAVAASRGGATLRGFDILICILDESEFFASNEDVASADGYAVNDRDIFQAQRPRNRGLTVLESTPWPTQNFTDELFAKNHGRPDDALACLGDSITMRPDDWRLERDAKAALESDPDNARREFWCEAGARGGSRLFDPAMVDACVVPGRALIIEAPYGAAIGCGGDLGLERDSSAIAIVSNMSGMHELCEFDEIKPTKDAPLTPGYVIRDRFAPIMQRHGARSITMDLHYRQSAVEHLTPLGYRLIDAPTGSEGKYATYMATRALVHGGKLRIPPSARLVAQFKAVTSTPLPGGGTRISSPRRAGQGHGDILSAVVLACFECRDFVRQVGDANRPMAIPIRAGAGFTDWDALHGQSTRPAPQPLPSSLPRAGFSPGGISYAPIRPRGWRT